jgi:hypothetical protein
MKSAFILLTTIFAAQAAASEVEKGEQLVSSGTSALDSTELIQRLINSGAAVVIPCGTSVTVTGLMTPPENMPVSIRGECPGSVIKITTYAPAIDCVAFKGALSVRDITIVGTGRNQSQDSVGTAFSDLGQRGIHLQSCPNVRIENVQFSNVAGNGLDVENSAFSFDLPQTALFSNISGSDNFRLIYIHNYGEYLSFVNVQAHSNMIGVEVESGNVTFSNSLFVFNNIGIKINGQAGQNPCHGSFTGGASNHNTINLMVTSCGLGEIFNGVDFLGGASGGISSNSAGIQIFNSRGITIANGQIGTNVRLSSADPNTRDSTLNGVNMLLNNFIRDELANFLPPELGTDTSLIKAQNYNSAGLVPWNGEVIRKSP